MPNKDSAKLRETIHFRITDYVTNSMKINDVLDIIMNRIEAHTAAQVAAADWQATKEVMPPVGQMVLCHITYDGSPEPTYAVLKHVDEDDCDWRTADDDSELSYWVNVTHWKPFAHLTTGQKEKK